MNLLMHALSATLDGMNGLLPWENEARNKSLASQLAAQTAHRIVERSLVAGHLLTEAELSATSGVSRTPAREAMLQLERWGLVRLMPKKGAVIKTITLEERRDLLATRGLFERGALQALASTPGSLADLAAALEQPLSAQRSAVANLDLLGFAGADFAFHAALVQVAGNTVLTDLLESLAPRLARLTYEVCLEHPEQLHTFLDEHELLATLARSGDATGFSQAITRHITDAHFPKKSS